jgi:hypothetical protein
LNHRAVREETPRPTDAGAWQDGVAELILSYGVAMQQYVGEKNGWIEPFFPRI